MITFRYFINQITNPLGLVMYSQEMFLVIHSLLPGRSVSPDIAKRHMRNSYSNFKIISSAFSYLPELTCLKNKNKKITNAFYSLSAKRYFLQDKWYNDSCIIVYLAHEVLEDFPLLYQIPKKVMVGNVPGGDTDKTADSNWPEGYPTLYNITFNNKCSVKGVGKGGRLWLRHLPLT